MNENFYPIGNEARHWVLRFTIIRSNSIELILSVMCASGNYLVTTPAAKESSHPLKPKGTLVHARGMSHWRALNLVSSVLVSAPFVTVFMIAQKRKNF